MKDCAESITKGSPLNGCSISLLAHGDTCPPPNVVVNGATTPADPTSWKDAGKQPLGQPGGRPGFFFFTSIHGPFYQNTPWDSYMNEPTAVADPPWDPPNKAPGFRGTYLRIYIEPDGQWMLAWGLDATDIKGSGGTPPGGPGGEIAGVAYDQIDSVPDPSRCGLGFHSITDHHGKSSPQHTLIHDPAGGSAAILSGLIGNVSRVNAEATGASPADAFLRVMDDSGRTILNQVHNNNPTPPLNQWFTGESWSNGCEGWIASDHYMTPSVPSNDDVLLVPAKDVADTICYIDGIAGDWSRWRSDGHGGLIVPSAQIYIDSSGYRLKVSPKGSEPTGVTAFATCLSLRN